jgi:large subunit ribosomal protein L17
MRHRKAGRQLGRNSGHRRALFRSLVTSILEHERIETTLPKAKEMRSFVEKMITLGKRGDLASRRRALAFIRKESVVRSLFSDIAPRFANRAGGYTRVVHSRRRLGDGAPMAIIELTELKPKVTTAGPEKKAKGAKKEKPEAAKAKAAG